MSKPMKHLAVNGIVYDVVDGTQSTRIDELDDKIDSVEENLSEDIADEVATRSAEIDEVNERIDNLPSMNIDTSMSDSSTNAVQNKVIKEYVDSSIPSITVDSSMSDSSTNAVQNKVIKAYVDSQSPSISIDTSMSDSSTNAVQNKVIKEYVDNSIPSISVDSAMSDTSTNAVQNKVIKAYVDSQTPSITLDTSMSVTSHNAVQNNTITGYIHKNTRICQYEMSNGVDETNDTSVLLDILSFATHFLRTDMTGFAHGNGGRYDVYTYTDGFEYICNVTGYNYETRILEYYIIGRKKIYFGKYNIDDNTLIDTRIINVGDTDISSIGDGTVTGAIGALNNNIPTVTTLNQSIEFSDTNFSCTEYFRYSQFGKIIILDFGGIVASNSATSAGITVPTAITRPVVTLFSAQSAQDPVMLAFVNNNLLYLQPFQANVACYGQMIYLTN